MHVMQDGFIDFKKNRAQYRKEKGLDYQDISSNELESQINQKDVENEFVEVAMKNKPSDVRDRDADLGLMKRVSVVSENPRNLRKSHVIRQINEGVMGVRNEDYDEKGELDEEKLHQRLSEQEAIRNSNKSKK